MLTKRNAERLLAVAKLVRSLPEEKFCMSIWKQKCGAAGCAIGHAIDAGLFPELELRQGYEGAANLAVRLIGGQSPYYVAHFHEEWDFKALESVLGIDYSSVENLFAPSSYPVDEPDLEEGAAPEDHIPREWVAERIEEFVAENTEGEV